MTLTWIRRAAVAASAAALALLTEDLLGDFQCRLLL